LTSLQASWRRNVIFLRFSWKTLYLECAEHFHSCQSSFLTTRVHKLKSSSNPKEDTKMDHVNPPPPARGTNSAITECCLQISSFSMRKTARAGNVYACCLLSQLQYRCQFPYEGEASNHMTRIPNFSHLTSLTDPERLKTVFNYIL
jgi:hypothetical protein